MIRPLILALSMTLVAAGLIGCATRAEGGSQKPVTSIAVSCEEFQKPGGPNMERVLAISAGAAHAQDVAVNYASSLSPRFKLPLAVTEK